MEELEAMYKDCQGSDDSNDGDDMDTGRGYGHGYGHGYGRYGHGYGHARNARHGYGHGYAMKDAAKAMQDAMDGM